MALSNTTFSIAGHELNLIISDECFTPVSTTQKFGDLIEMPDKAQVLDIGCGVGPLAIVASLKGASRVVGVDVVPVAIDCAKKNAEAAGVGDQVEFICGSLYEPVANQMFDVIVNDVSGISEEAARISNWYPEDVPSGGDDGADLVIQVLEGAPAHLNPGGSLYFATASLSNVPRIMEHANKAFEDRVHLLQSYRFPFSPAMESNIDEFIRMQSEGKIDFTTKRSRHLWTLDVYRADAAG